MRRFLTLVLNGLRGELAVVLTVHPVVHVPTGWPLSLPPSPPSSPVNVMCGSRIRQALRRHVLCLGRADYGVVAKGIVLTSVRQELQGVSHRSAKQAGLLCVPLLQSPEGYI